jgi:hypothetical protein
LKIRPTICIPLYRLPLSNEELISLDSLNRYLSKYDRCVIAPETLKNSVIEVIGKGNVIYFESSFFKSPTTYSHLLLTKEFYKKFANYSHILIYQLDCLVFKDHLMTWCESPWDYIGSPWFKGIDKDIGAGLGFFAAGNGGFSLRRVSKCLDVLNRSSCMLKLSTEKCWGEIPPNANLIENRRGDLSNPNLLHKVLSYVRKENTVEWQAMHYRFHEDMFWSTESIRFDPTFQVAPVDAALKFGFERHPRVCFDMTRGELPFGCHGWNKYDREFWAEQLRGKI